MSHRHQFDEQRFRALWEYGCGVVEIGSLFNKSKSWATLTAQRLGLPRRATRLTLADRNEIAAAYRAGASMRVLRDAMRGRHPTIERETIARALRLRGVKIRKRREARKA